MVLWQSLGYLWTYMPFCIMAMAHSLFQGPVTQRRFLLNTLKTLFKLSWSSLIYKSLEMHPKWRIKFVSVRSRDTWVLSKLQELEYHFQKILDAIWRTRRKWNIFWFFSSLHFVNQKIWGLHFLRKSGEPKDDFLLNKLKTLLRLSRIISDF